MKVLVTICARAGSKGVKGKNIREINGKPLIYWSIMQALKWGKADDMIVSTDSESIANIARKYGAQIPFIRDEQLATDISGKVSVIKDAWEKCENIYNKKYDYVIDFDVTAPLRKIEDIDGCLDVAIKNKALNVFSVVNAHRNPYFNMIEPIADNRAVICKERDINILSRQEAPKAYDMNASIYVYSREFMQKNIQSVLTDKTYFYIMNDISRYDIDSELDFKVMELFLEKGLWRF